MHVVTNSKDFGNSSINKSQPSHQDIIMSILSKVLTFNHSTPLESQTPMGIIGTAIETQK